MLWGKLYHLKQNWPSSLKFTLAVSSHFKVKSGLTLGLNSVTPSSKINCINSEMYFSQKFSTI